MGMADEYFAKAMASKGGLGLAKMISAGMEKRTQSAANEHE
jgi:Rod binding domain-containing protein